MSGNGEEFKDKLNSLVKSAVAGDTDLDDVKQALDDASDRIEEIQAAWGDA